MSSHQHFFQTYATHNGFKYNPKNDPEIEFKRLAAQMRWVLTTFEKKYFECFQRNYQPIEEKPLNSQDYFLHFQNYNGFDHKSENLPLYEFLRLAKHMGWVGPTLKLNKQAFNIAMNNQMCHEKKEGAIGELESTEEIVINISSEEKKRETSNQKSENEKNDIKLNVAQNSNNDQNDPFVYPNEESLIKSNSTANIFNVPREKQISDDIPKIMSINQNAPPKKKMMKLNPNACSFKLPSVFNEEKQAKIEQKIDKIFNYPLQRINNEKFPNKKIDEKNMKKNPKTPFEFFKHYEKFQKFPFNRKNDYLDEFERMVKYFKWGDVQSTVERDKLLKCIVAFEESKNDLNDNEKQNIKPETPKHNIPKSEDKSNFEIEKNAISDQNKRDQEINVISDQSKIELEQNPKIDQNKIEQGNNDKICQNEKEQQTLIKIDQNLKNLNEMQNLIYEQKNNDESHQAINSQAINIQLTCDYFDTYVTHHHFVRVETNDPYKEYDRLAKHMNWGKTPNNNHYNNHWPHFLESLRTVVNFPKEIKKESIFVEKYTKKENQYECSSNYFTTYVKYHKFEHFKNNYPLDEYERLAKHMNWGPNHYKDHKKMFLQTLTNVKGKWQYKNEAYKSQNNFKKDENEGNLNLTWKRKIPDATKIIYEKKETKNEEISKNPNQNYFKEDEKETTEKFDPKMKLDSKKESINEKNKEVKFESNPDKKKKKIESNDQKPEIRNAVIQTQEKQIGFSLYDRITIKNQKNEIPLRKLVESSKTNQNQQKQTICINKKNIGEIDKNNSDSEEEKKVNLNHQYHKPVSDSSSSSEEKKNCNDTIEFERDMNLEGNFKLKDEEFSFEEDFCYDTYNCEWNRTLENEVFPGDDD